jgi:uncharacterized protein YegL
MSEKVVSNKRRLPVYILVDCSESMAGEPIEAVRNALRVFLDDMKNDPQALECLWLSVITFNNVAEVVVPLTKISMFKEPVFTPSGPAILGKALDLLIEMIIKNSVEKDETNEDNLNPLVFIYSDGHPIDNWEGSVDNLKNEKIGSIICCAASPGADQTVLQRISDKVIRLHDMSQGKLDKQLRWDHYPLVTISTSPELSSELPSLPEDEGIKIVQ